MKLHFFDDDRNFGDQLNPWMWPQFFQKELVSDDSFCLVGIGTILDQKIPVNSIKIILGSGTGYDKCAPIDDSWRFIAVRGPLTAARLGLSNKAVLTDSAILLSVLDRPTPTRGEDVLFVPHITSSLLYDWKTLCINCGIEYIDPTLDVEHILSRICGAKLVIAEAMHAAIIADTYRVPWAPIVIYPHINEFKWVDWCLSLGMAYRPVQFNSLYHSFCDEREIISEWFNGNGLHLKLLNLPEHLKMSFFKLSFSRRMVSRADLFRIKIKEICEGRGVMMSEEGIFKARVSSYCEKIELVREMVKGTSG